MPLYTISTQSSLPVQQREQLAKLIMDVHCGLTGAPETFVNVLFSTNAPLNRGIALNILGTVRKGRTATMNDELQLLMMDKVSELLRIPQLQMEISLFEIPARWIMEGGEILPEPGEEDDCEWLQNGHGE
ncbi:hypothetical protein J7384_03635 [Endozoicomonas sp. G2_1]|uniref:tautomerase family protein n=1 Tax=Endozoicomonas sp. G2_1 TaxID=2821091 RepID=UPI001ADBF8A0|nr:tautomerase family protein [Endozoicomonas sp. G2_1]MBO9489447.1 hypothetical protein [Endozoicomonas sp. G2_1]